MHANNYNYNTITISYHITKNTSKKIEKTYQQDAGAHTRAQQGYIRQVIPQYYKLIY